MAKAKRVGLLLMGVLLWVGLCQIDPQVPWAGERQAAAPRDHPAAGGNRVFARAEILSSGEAVEICSQVEQPTAILYVVPAGKTVKKGDLLVELDASALIDKRIQQVIQVQKAEGEMIQARETQAWDAQAAQGRIVLAEKALRLAQNQLKAYTEGEYPRQLILAEGAANVAKLRLMLAGERTTRLRASSDTQKDQNAQVALQEAQIAQDEAAIQVEAAQSALAILKSFVHDNKVAELELIVAQKEFDLARAKDDLSRANTIGRAAMAWAEQSFHRESDRLAKMDDQIVKSKIYAPRDGIVAYPNDAGEPPIKAGAIVRNRQVLLRLSAVATSRRGE